MTHFPEKVLASPPGILRVHPWSFARRFLRTPQGDAFDRALHQRLFEAHVEMKGSVSWGQTFEFPRRVNVDHRHGGGGKERQLVDRLRRARAAQPAGTVCRHGDETTSAVRRFEHGRQQLGGCRARSGDDRDRPPVARFPPEREKSRAAFFEK